MTYRFQLFLERICDEYDCKIDTIKDDSCEFIYRDMKEHYDYEAIIIGQIVKDEKGNDISPIWDLYDNLEKEMCAKNFVHDWNFHNNNGEESGYDYHRIFVWWSDLLYTANKFALRNKDKKTYISEFSYNEIPLTYEEVLEFLSYVTQEGIRKMVDEYSI